MSVLHRTQSLCPICLRRVDAVYCRANFESGSECGAKSECGSVLMAESQFATADVLLRKTCPEHGVFETPAWAGAYSTAPRPNFARWSRPKQPSYPARPVTTARHGCPYDCGLCPMHAQHTCTGLVEVTMRCDMACPVCYAEAGTQSGTLSGMRTNVAQVDFAPADPPLEAVAAQLDLLRTVSGGCNVQISGGEPTMREDLPQILTLARQYGFGLVQLNTNGLRLAAEAGYARRLRAAGLDSIYLQWDGARESAFTALRGRPCLEQKRHALMHCAEAGLGIVLVATVVRGVNDDQLGEILRQALAAGPAVRGLHLQPAAWFGRFPESLAAVPRLTLPELMAALAAQAPELVNINDFHPPGCEHALCSFSAVYARTKGPHGVGLAAIAGTGEGLACCAPRSAAEGARAAKSFTALHWKGLAATGGAGGLGNTDGASTTVPANDAFSRFVAEAGAEQRFTLSGMAFQDVYSLDLERTRGCCIHVARTDGKVMPFCLHNLTACGGTRLHPGGRP